MPSLERRFAEQAIFNVSSRMKLSQTDTKELGRAFGRVWFEVADKVLVEAHIHGKRRQGVPNAREVESGASPL